MSSPRPTRKPRSPCKRHFGDEVYPQLPRNVDTVGANPSPTHGPSGLNKDGSRIKAKINLSASPAKKKSLANPTLAKIEDGPEEEGEGGASEDRPSKSWLKRHMSEINRALRKKAKRQESAKPPDYFLEKFSIQAFGDPEDPMYQATTSLFGIKLAFDPTHVAYYYWLTIITLAILYNIIIVIGRACFWHLNNLTSSWFIFDLICDVIYYMDVLIHCHEGYLEEGLMVKEGKMLRQHYFNSAWWRLDCLSLLPTEIVYFWWSPSSCSSTCLPCPVIVRLNRLFRAPRMWEWIERTETITSFPNAFRIVKVVMGILIIIHWNSCFYFITSFSVGFGSDEWVYNLTENYESNTLGYQYIYCFYWSTLTLTTIGETPTPITKIEYVFTNLNYLIGVLVLATVVGNITSVILDRNASKVLYQKKIDAVKRYMAHRKICPELQNKVIQWFTYTWESGAMDEENVLSVLPDKLKAELAIRVHLDTLRKVPIFQDCAPGLLEALVLKLKLQVFSPGDYICRKGDVGKEMYIIKRGRLQVVADDGETVLVTLSAGAVFGEVSILKIPGNRIGNKRTANVRSVGFSDIFCLSKKDLWETLNDYPDARTTLINRGCELLRKDGLLDEAVFEKAQTTQQSLPETVRELERTVDILQNRLGELMAELGEEQAKTHKRITKLEKRLADQNNEETTSFEGSDIQDEIAQPCDADVNPMQSIAMSHYFRERGHSLSVERPGLLPITTEPRSKSLRLKKTSPPSTPTPPRRRSLSPHFRDIRRRKRVRQQSPTGPPNTPARIPTPDLKDPTRKEQLSPPLKDIDTQLKTNKFECDKDDFWCKVWDKDFIPGYMCLILLIIGMYWSKKR